MYQALYRKWRPRTFDDVVGQEQVTETLKNQIISGRLSHAYLFIGTRGTGKTTCAKILARAVNCENPINGNPCNKCKSCLGIEDGSIMDVVEMDAASNNGVDNVRALRDEAIFSPAVVKKRVYIIDEVHMLSTSAFNALLKILEEPPEHLMFILATTELNKVPATILSRCQRHSFKRVDPDSMAGRIAFVAQQENMQLDKAAAELLARLADGSLRDGLSLLDQCSGTQEISVESVLSSMGLAGNMRITELLNAIIDGQTQAALELFGALWRDGKAPATLLTELCTLLRDMLMSKLAPKGGRELLSGGYDLNTLIELSKRLSSEEIISDIDAIQVRIGALRDGRDPKIAAELCIVGLCEPDLGDNLDCLRARVARLETSIEEGIVFSHTSQITQIQENNENKAEAQNTAALPLNLSEKDKKSTIMSDEDSLTQLLEEDAPPFDEIPSEKQNYYESAQNAPIEHNGAKAAPMADEAEDDVPPFDMPEPKEMRLPPKEEKQISEPEPAMPAQPIAGAATAWTNILAELKGTMHPGIFNVVSHMAMGEMTDVGLSISVAGAFERKQLEQTEAQEQIRTAIQNVLGKAVPFKITERQAAESTDAGKLDKLTQFGNVKFE
ncbi:MAG: DNA polymerase III subunit gamma/tau [Oscillospiraceae bacterium]